MLFYAQTMPGIEEVAWLEIREKLAGARFVEKLYAKEKNGIVIFEYDGDPNDLLQLRTTEDVFILALSLDDVSRGWKDLYKLTELISKKGEFRFAIDALMMFQKTKNMTGTPTYRVISRQYGRYEYRRIDLARSVEKGMKARYKTWRHVDDHARVEVWVNLLGSRLICGLRLTDRTMRHRFNKVKELPASLRPSMAAAMVFLTQPEDDDVFLDPMCGSGTLLMERRLAGAYGQMLGGDIEKSRALATKLNVRGMRKKRPFQFSTQQLDAQTMPFATGSINKMVVNLPFGKQIGSPKEIKRLYPRFFAEVARVLKVNGRVIVLSSKFELVKNTVRRQPGLTLITGYSVAILGRWGRIYIIERTD